MGKGVVCLIVLTVVLGCVYCAPRLRARRGSLDGLSRKRRQDPGYPERRLEELTNNHHAIIIPMFYQRDAGRNKGILTDDRKGWPLAHSEGQESPMNPWYNFRRRYQHSEGQESPMNPWYNFRRRYQARNMIQRDPISQELRGRVSSQMSDGMIPLEIDQDYF